MDVGLVVPLLSGRVKKDEKEGRGKIDTPFHELGPISGWFNFSVRSFQCDSGNSPSAQVRMFVRSKHPYTPSAGKLRQ